MMLLPKLIGPMPSYPARKKMLLRLQLLLHQKPVRHLLLMDNHITTRDITSTIQIRSRRVLPRDQHLRLIREPLLRRRHPIIVSMLEEAAAVIVPRDRHLLPMTIGEPLLLRRRRRREGHPVTGMHKKAAAAAVPRDRRPREKHPVMGMLEEAAVQTATQAKDILRRTMLECNDSSKQDPSNKCGRKEMIRTKWCNNLRSRGKIWWMNRKGVKPIVPRP